MVKVYLEIEYSYNSDTLLEPLNVGKCRREMKEGRRGRKKMRVKEKKVKNKTQTEKL